MRKSNLISFKVVDAHSLAASFNSDPTNINFLDNVGYEIDLSGAATFNGSIAVQASNSYKQDDEGNVVNTGTWITLTSQAIVAGSPSNSLFSLNQVPFAYLRLSITRTSGTGTMSAYVSAKMV